MAKRLQLDWPHKGEHVLRNQETARWEFCGGERLPPRPLIEIKAFGQAEDTSFDPGRSNLLVKGENLFALRSLLRYYERRVKLVYIDPPFNRGKEDFDVYDDNFPHSVWLSMMQERLQVIERLLTGDGVVFVHIGTQEVARLMLLMDEVFGPKNFMNLIAMTTNDPSGFKATASNIFSTVNFLVVYAKNKPQCTLRRVSLEKEFDKQYSQYLLNPHEHYGNWKWCSVFDHVANTLGHPDRKAVQQALGQDEFEQKVADFAIEHADRVFQTAAIQGGARAKRLATIELSQKKRGQVFVHPNENIEDFYIVNGRQILFYAKRLVEIDGRKVPGEILTDVWRDISWNGIAREGGVQLKEGKKPEALLRRVIELGSERGDLVLDSFAGSGTTGAVAHKMGRRWIMVELNSQAETMCLPRLQRVIDGKDQTGVSQELGWQGGGGFRFLEVGAPLFMKDQETQLTILNPHYKNGPLVRAVCNLEGFLLNGDRLLHGRNGTHWAHVTEDFVDDAVIAKLRRKLPQGHSLTIYTLKAKRGLKPPAAIAVKRMNVELVKRYLTKNR